MPATLTRQQRAVVRALFDSDPEPVGFPLSGRRGRTIATLQAKGLIIRVASRQRVLWLLTTKGHEVAERMRGR